MPRIKKTNVEKSATRERREVTFNVPVMKVPKPFQGFMDFIRGHGVIALAIGLFLGTSLKTILDAFTANIVNPIIGVSTGNLNLNSMSVCISHSRVTGICKSSLGYGAVLSTVISFVIAAFVVYLIIKLLRLDKFDQTKE